MTSILSSAQKKNLTALIVELGQEVEIIKQSDLDVFKKNHNSPVTEADLYINNELKKYFEEISVNKIISEESKVQDHSIRSNWKFFWVVDPIDGTKEFLKKSNDYTINVALCKDNMPIFSIVSAPGDSLLYHAERNNGSYLNGRKISVNKNLKAKLKVVVSKSHMNKKTQNFLRVIKQRYAISLVNIGSSLKICKVAEGSADLYPRLGPTMEWDTCAAHLILNEAGGTISCFDGEKLTYNKENLRNPFFIASSGTHISYENINNW